MKYSQLFSKTLRQPPKETKAPSNRFLVQAGFIDQLASGIFSYLPLGWRVYQKIEKIIREEMDAIDGQELFLPSLHPHELWQETGRWTAYVPPLFKTKDQHGHDFCLAPTHEEVMTDLCRKLISSYKDLPKAVYQIQNKFRNEARATGGLLRVREFMMKDLYSFHADEKDLDRYYQKVYQAYEKIFQRCGLETQAVEASSGSIGGSFNHEFMFFCPTGEDRVAVCDKCSYMANLEKAEGKLENKNADEKELPLKEIAAKRGLNMEAMVEFYKKPAWRLLKTIVYFVNKKPMAILIRGDLEINETKLESVLGTSDFRIPEPEELEKLATVRGFVAPIDLKVNRFLVDKSVLTVKNLITGANKLNIDIKNFNYPRDLKKAEVVDVAVVNNQFLCAKCEKGKLKIKTAIELGHVFKLGTKYSSQMKAEYLDKRGKKRPVWMGCYGIGLGRLMAAVVEASHDEKGIIWPESVAPFQVHLINIGAGADKIYEKLVKAGVDVLYDDRDDVSAGVKFADADLIGIPVRLVVSEKTLRLRSGQAKDKIEWKKRDSEKTELLSLQEIFKRLKFS